jgi:predicted phage terminase large subunit-like protein
VQSWDCASKSSELNDYSVCTTWGITEAKDMYLLHVLRERLEYPELKRKLRQQAEQHRAGIVLIEDTAAGVQLIQELKYEGFARIEAYKPLGDKIMRMAAQTPAIEAGRVYLPYDAPWLHDLEHELAMFPRGRHDDQVDSMAQALAYVGKPNSADAWFEYLRGQILQQHGIRPEQLTVIFDHEDRDARFNGCTGRRIFREADGFYHATQAEWGLIKTFTGVKLVE